ncbi:MAG TPA: anthranilate synthase component I family protein [Candidatus Thermoplasmatota archaeon]|nr:anthranilate synthase component I family protein [Candidatus Thermoplasmatota archaeon]
MTAPTPGLLVERLPDALTAWEAFLKVHRPGERALFLDSTPEAATTDAERALRRWSFVAWAPRSVLAIRDGRAEVDGRAVAGDAGEALARFVRGAAARFDAGDAPAPFAGGAAGLFAYEALRLVERVPAARADPLGVPDVLLGDYDRVLAFDHAGGRAWLLARDKDAAADAHERLARPAPAVPALGPCRLDTPPPAAAFEAAVARAKTHVAAGDVYQANLSQRLVVLGVEDPVAAYARLRARNPAPFAAFFDAGDFHVLSASPERLARVAGREVEARPIAGTRPRGATAEADRALAAELARDEKERAEHAMLVDLARNDLGRVARFGSVRVDGLAFVETYRSVHHLVSRVVGDLADGADAVDAWRATFPGGTITGAPKVRAMEIIADLEGERRGPYTGALGYLAPASMDLNILIRTLVVKDGRAHLRVGAGIVEDSVPARERAETLAKAKGVLDALGVAR